MTNIDNSQIAEDRSGSIVLFYPLDGLGHLRIPLGLLALAGPLEKEGYNVRIIAAAMEPDYKDKVICALQDAICLGISCIIGRQICEGLNMAMLVKAKYPFLPIVCVGYKKDSYSASSFRINHIFTLLI